MPFTFASFPISESLEQAADTSTMFTYSSANTPLGQLECASYLFSYFSKICSFVGFTHNVFFVVCTRGPRSKVKNGIRFSFRPANVFIYNFSIENTTLK